MVSNSSNAIRVTKLHLQNALTNIYNLVGI